MSRDTIQLPFLGNELKKDIDIAIFGAGPSGLMLAYLLSKKQYNVKVYEASNEVGGLSQSIQLWGEHVELGPHFIEYNSDALVQELIDSLFDPSELIFFDKKAAILTKDNKKFIYPPQPKELFRKMSLIQLIVATIEFLRSKIVVREVKNAKDYLVKTLGNYFYLNFFKEYSFKLWGIEDDKLDISYASNLLPFRNFKGVLNKIFLRKNVEFKYVYFKYGISDLWNKLFCACVAQGVEFIFDFKVDRCIFKNNLFSFNSFNGKSAHSSLVVSTLPFTVNRAMFGLKLEHSYTFRNLILVYIKLNSENPFKEQCLYLHSNKIKAVRACNFPQFTNSFSSTTIILLEYWEGNTELWNADTNKINKTATNDLKMIVSTFDIQDIYIKKIPNGYIVPRCGTDKMLNEEKIFSKGIPFYSIGRNNTIQFNYGISTAINESNQFSQKF